MLDTTGEAGGSLRAFLKIGAGSLAHKQLALALAGECTKIICIARSLTPELVNLQHEVERAGAKFHCIPGARALSGLVTAVDEVLVISDGLLAPQYEGLDLLARGQGIIVQPIEIGLAAGFERIDADHAAAGLMRIPGRLVEQLSLLPDDCDVASALTRIALQAGMVQRKLPSETRVKILRNQTEADVTEAEWFDLQLRGSSFLAQGPGMWLARLVVRQIGPAMLNGQSGSRTFALVSVFAILLALALGWYGFIATALIGMALASMAGLSSGILCSVEQESLALLPDRWRITETLNWLVDGALVAIVAWNIPVHFSSAGWYRVFAPLMLLIVLRLITGSIKSAWSNWLSDRTFFCLVIVVAVAAGWLSQAVCSLAVCLGLFGLFWSKNQLKLT